MDNSTGGVIAYIIMTYMFGPLFILILSSFYEGNLRRSMRILFLTTAPVSIPIGISVLLAIEFYRMFKDSIQDKIS